MVTVMVLGKYRHAQVLQVTNQIDLGRLWAVGLLPDGPLSRPYVGTTPMCPLCS